VPVLTIREFNVACARQVRRGWWTFAPLAGCVAVALLLHLLLIESCYGWFKAHIHPQTPRFAVMIGLITALATLLTFVGMRVSGRLYEWIGRRDPQLVCPHCGDCLALVGSWVIATRTCRACNGRVLAEPRRRPAEHPLPPRSEMETLRVLFKWRMWRIALVVVIWCACGGLGWCVLGDSTEPIWVVIGIVWMISGMCLAGWMFARALGMEQHLRCPRCERPYGAGWAVVTGHCGRCGQQLVADPPTGGVAAGGGTG
jgi:hypothetical protein